MARAPIVRTPEFGIPRWPLRIETYTDYLREGATTAAIEIGFAAHQACFVTAIVDLDPQGTAANWGGRRKAEGPSVIGSHASRLGVILETERQSGTDIAIIDTPPSAEAVAANHQPESVSSPRAICHCKSADEAQALCLQPMQADVQVLHGLVSCAEWTGVKLSTLSSPRR